MICVRKLKLNHITTCVLIGFILLNLLTKSQSRYC
uniref:Uncharacterized protein n=1 Tax=Myoviridae sp. ctKhy9 TaxID=2827677 RepID=A0A8S5SJZ8_9CAUD|nr:MAG TPA: hypothetical protein [Myoviridae sp. ctKhy9]